jgi:hypothetical protein
LAFLIIVSFLIAHTYVWPYKIKEANWLETGLSGLNIGIIGIALLFTTGDPLNYTFGGNESLYRFYASLVLVFLSSGVVIGVSLMTRSLYHAFHPPTSKVIQLEDIDDTS